jgi:tetratricopeptide (TPR) repeat protein
MVALNAADPEAYLARFRYRSAHKIAGAAADLEKARQLAPDNVEVLLASVISAAESDRGLARKYGERVQEVAPKDRRVYVILANLFTRWNQPDEAILILRAGLKRIGAGDIDLNRSLLRLFLFVRNAEEARSTLKRIEPVAQRIGPYLPPPIRSRLAEDLEVARAEVQILDGKTALAFPALKRLAANVAEGSNPAETLAERQRRWRR